MVIDVREEIKLSIWLVERYRRRDMRWYLDAVYKFEKDAANHIAVNREMLEFDEVHRMRRFVEEGRTPRGQKVGEKNG